MKRITIVLLLLAALVSEGKAESGVGIGVIASVKDNEVVIKNRDIAHPPRIGDMLFVYPSDGVCISLRVTFPMQASSRCVVVQGKIVMLTNGMPVYAEKFPVALKKDINGNATDNRGKVDSRFVDNGDGTISDRQSGLIWVKNANLPGKALSLSAARDFCAQLREGGFTDWRLPEKKELETLTSGLEGRKDWRVVLSGNGFINLKELYWTNDYGSLYCWCLDLVSCAYYNMPSYHMGGGSAETNNVIAVRNAK